MTTQWNSTDDDIESAYALAGTDDLGVLSTTRPVVEAGEWVWINRDSLDALVDQLHAFSQEKDLKDSAPAPAPVWYEQYHFFDGTVRTLNWLLVLDALNFCFWAEKDALRWRIEYQGEILNGYWAEAASLKRGAEEGFPLWDARYLSSMSSEDLAHIFRGVPPENGDSPAMIPLFEQRLANAHEVGNVLLERYDGQFAHVIEEAGRSAVKLALLLAEAFPSFHDVASYRKREVRLLKRAQICAADLYGAFGGKLWGALTDLDQLTIFADYKLPQILRHFGVLEYHPELAERIDKLELLEPGGEEEVEIRAATVWACELLRQIMTMAGVQSITAAEIDQQLWLLSQNITSMRPYHRVRTMYY